jgi:transcription-repair coupling factor (superfamily II helicase)
VRVALVVEDDGRSERLLEMLAPHGLVPVGADDPLRIERGRVSVLKGELSRGFVAPQSGWAFVPVQALFGVRRRTSDRAHVLFEGGVSSLGQLKVDDPVVHRVHGVGLYRGLVRLEVQAGIEQDFVKLAYRDEDVLFLPVTALEQLSRYTPASSGAAVVLDRLGGQTWARRKGKVRDHLLSMAQDLLRLHGRREIAVRPAYAPPGRRSLAFEARFPHEETPDQAVAIAAVHEDLSKPFPMDRLVCGDVGFGKTEVALRAAMRVVEHGRQVAVLCPTTVLAHQHYRSFRQRFADDPGVRVAMVSRFTPAADLPSVLEDIANGTVHVVVGTTALLGRKVRFADLGLFVVDEEHRFGVTQKERLKRMRTEVDILSLSATPIPRTLQMALSGVREMSLIATPPPDRLAVRTSLSRFTEARVRDLIVTEIERGGQVYVVHNRIETLGKIADQVASWVPEARVLSAHGQMDADVLERVLVDFVDRACDVLVSTAIVESGVDLPNVNTMIVDRADLFGVAQLYQLRGRVGRGDRRATCVLCVPDELPVEARRRLRVIVEHQSLGSGFHVAAADLELRGGGNLLGAAQSGNIDQVGYETWLDLLEEAVHAARGDLERERIDPVIEVPVPAFLPDALVTDPQERLTWYRRIASARTERDVERALEDLETEHGDLPDEARNLGDLGVTRLACHELGVVRCTWLKVRVVLELHPSSTLDARRIQTAAKRHPKRFEVTEKPARTVSVRFTPAEGETPFRFLKWVFAQLRRTDD